MTETPDTPVQAPDPSTVTIRLPDEFVALCQRDNLTPEVVLRCFIADLCGILNYAANPREDGYDSSDERELAQAYYYRLSFLRGFGFDQ